VRQSPVHDGEGVAAGGTGEVAAEVLRVGAIKGQGRKTLQASGSRDRGQTGLPANFRQKAPEIHGSLVSPRAGVLQVGVALQAAPEVPTGHGAIRAPAVGHPLHLVRGGEGLQLVSLADRVADAQIAGGENVSALEGEDQEHVDGPDADAFHLCEAEDDFVVGEGGEILEDHFPIAGVAGEVADVGGLLSGEPQQAHAGGAESEDGFGGDYALDGGGEPAEDHTGDASAELLEDDRFDQGLEIRRAELDTIIANLFDNGGEHRVVGAEVVDGLLHVETRTRRDTSTLLYRDANTYTCRTFCGQRTAGAGPAIH